MTAINKIIIILLGFIFTHISFAVIPKDFLYSDALNVPCKVGSPIQEDLMYCVSRDYIESDEKLNTNYQNSLKKLNPIKKRKLKLEQKKWYKLKNRKCNNVYKNMNGGREAPIEFLSCHSEENTKRIQILNTQSK